MLFASPHWLLLVCCCHYSGAIIVVERVPLRDGNGNSEPLSRLRACVEADLSRVWELSDAHVLKYSRVAFAEDELQIFSEHTPGRTLASYVSTTKAHIWCDVLPVLTRPLG